MLKFKALRLTVKSLQEIAPAFSTPQHCSTRVTDLAAWVVVSADGVTHDAAWATSGAIDRPSIRGADHTAAAAAPASAAFMAARRSTRSGRSASADCRRPSR